MVEITLARFLSSGVGKKILVATTGIFLSLFLVLHCYINLMLLFPNAEEQFNKAAHFMATFPVVRISEVILFAALILHAYQSLALHFANKSKRSVPYLITAGNKSSKWYARSMGLLGTLVLLFLVVHLYHFWVPARFTEEGLTTVRYENESMPNMYQLVQQVFQNEWAVIIYVIGCIALGWHLYHGVGSAFRTFGCTHPMYMSWVRTLGAIYAVLISALFVLMPVMMYFQMRIPFSFG